MNTTAVLLDQMGFCALTFISVTPPKGTLFYMLIRTVKNKTEEWSRKLQCDSQDLWLEGCACSAFEFIAVIMVSWFKVKHKSHIWNGLCTLQKNKHLFMCWSQGARLSCSL